MTLSLAVALAVRCLLVVLFLPCSALDKILDFRGAVAQAKEQVASEVAAKLLIIAGACVEIAMSLGVVTGVADRLAAFILAGYCGVTALLWKQFWRPGDSAVSVGRCRLAWRRAGRSRAPRRAAARPGRTCFCACWSERR